jgi:hypothetical protein
MLAIPVGSGKMSSKFDNQWFGDEESSRAGVSFEPAGSKSPPGTQERADARPNATG